MAAIGTAAGVRLGRAKVLVGPRRPTVDAHLVAGDFVDRLRQALAGRPARQLHVPGARPAAVLVLLYRIGLRDHLVLTRRTDLVESHKGQISFPGGARDPADPGPVETALRECREEIGVDPSDVEVLGLLDDVLTATSRFRITPVVGLLRKSPYPFRPSPGEVAEILAVPVDWLADPEHLRVRTGLPDGRPHTDFAWEYEGHLIWGATGQVLKALLDLLGPGAGQSAYQVGEGQTRS